jgi:ribosomal protein S12 methylthiotransferase
MYAYPAKFPLDVLDVIAGHPHICKYLDMPVQHCSDRVLKSMRRGTSRRALTELIATIRERVPGIALRTTLIVGYPEEGDQEFSELTECVREMQFDRLGVFTYSQEEGTTAHPLGDPVSAVEKDRRLAEVMEIQQHISREKNERCVGTRRTVVIDRQEGDVYVGRTEKDAPEIDNEVYVRSPRPLRIGGFYDVDIEDASEYDVYGTVCTVESPHEAE